MQLYTFTIRNYISNATLLAHAIKILTLSYLFAFQTQNKTHVDLRIDIYVCTVVYWHINPIMCFISVMCGSGFKNVSYGTFLMT